MSSRACFISSSGDPFILGLVLKLWKERWYGEIDRMYVCFNNNNIPFEVAAESFKRYANDDKMHYIYHPRRIGNGMPITQMARISEEDLIMLLEDDGFIFEEGIVNDCFQKIESDLHDIVGSPRGSCGPEIWEASKVKYGLDYTGYGDVGPNWWPNFFFCKRKDLLRTDMQFASKTFQQGEYCKELNYTFKEVNHGDTFVFASMQLRSMGLRSYSIPQHKAGVYEMTDKQNKEQNWHPTQQPFKWIHGGSLSAGWSGYLTGVPMAASDDSSKREMESRCAFWQLASDKIEGFDEFKKVYKQGIQDLIKNANLDPGNINQKYNIYQNLMRI